MKTLTLSIGEAAVRSGFPAATLRYYDELGLVQPAQRAANGYRRYVESDLERLRFIGRAKHLGCSLEDISSLLGAYDGGECGPIQEQLSALVDAKIGQSKQQIFELTMLLAELQRAAADLERHRPKGACDEQCGCISQPQADSSRPSDKQALGSIATGLSLGRSQAVAIGTPPIACSLEPSALPERIGEFRALFAKTRRRLALDCGLRLEFDETIDLSALTMLLAAEQQCCAFWRFSITIDQRGIALEVRGPEGTADLIDTLFGISA